MAATASVRRWSLSGVQHGVRRLAPAPVRRADLDVFRLVARTRLPVVGRGLPVLSAAANRSRLWLGIAGLLAVAGGPGGRRGAVRGLLALGATSLVTNVPAKLMAGRRRPDLELVPELRRLAVAPTSTSFPSGHAASALAFATAVGIEQPRLRAPLLGLAGAVAFSRIYTGVHYPGDVLVGGLLGTAIARATLRFWPLEAPPPGVGRGEPVTVDTPVDPDGTGLVVVANAAAGNALGPGPADRLRRALPGARILEVDPEEGLGAALRRAAGQARVLGVAGGDGSASAGAEVAADLGVPLLVVPGGTLNHLARDVGLEEVGAAIAAVRHGRVVRMTLAELDGRVFVNAASLGLYPVLVTARERLESRIGKWPAALLTAARLLVMEVPTRVEIDGRRRSVWLVWFGNGRFVDAGLSPTRRDRLDDPVLDVRLVSAEIAWARTRIAVAAMTGRMARSPVYERWTARSVRVRSLQGPLQLAKDGESWTGSTQPSARVHHRSVLLLLPPLPDVGS